MKSIKIDIIQIERVFVLFVIAELILGGSGRLIAFGPLSLRILILVCLLAFDFVLLVEKKIKANNSNVVLICLLFYFACILCYSIVINNRADAINSFTGYLVISVCPAFIYFFSRNKDFLPVLRKAIYVCTIILSFVTIALWLFCIVSVGTAYAFLWQFQYGALAYVGPIPRLFLKGSIFICCSLFFAVTDYLEQRKIKYLIVSCLYLAAIAVTFTTSFYAFTAVILLFVFYHYYGRKHFVYALILLVLICLLGALIMYKAGIFSIFAQRFSGDYDFSYKGTQFKRVLEEFAKRPVFGYGFGYPITIDYGYTVVTAYSFEIMWLQLLLDTGIIGFALFAGHVLLTFYQLHLQYINSGNTIYMSLSCGLLMFCLVSFTNPFMNNAIGLLYYAICVGAAFSPYRSINDEKGAA